MLDLLDDVSSLNLGATVTVRPGERVGVVRAYGPDQRAQMLSVVMSLLETESSPVTKPQINVTGIIRWGIGGQQNSAEVDLGLGAVVSVPASFVEVTAQNDSEAGSVPVTISASVGYGPRAPTGIPGAFKTINYPATFEDPPSSGDFYIPTSGSQRLRIPRWATAGVVVFQPASGTAIIVVTDSRGDSIYNVSVSSGDSFPVVGPAWSAEIVPTELLTAAWIQYALVL